MGAGFVACGIAPPVRVAALPASRRPGYGNGLLLVYERLLIQTLVPDALRGRVFGVRDAIRPGLSPPLPAPVHSARGGRHADDDYCSAARAACVVWPASRLPCGGSGGATPPPIAWLLAGSAGADLACAAARRRARRGRPRWSRPPSERFVLTTFVTAATIRGSNCAPEFASSSATASSRRHRGTVDPVGRHRVVRVAAKDDTSGVRGSPLPARPSG